jgi:hypothetical protein
VISKIIKIKIYRNIFFCFDWVRNMVSHIREEHRLRVFEDIVLRRISAPMREMEQEC